MENRQVRLRKTERPDLEALFEIQQDHEGMYLAAFTPLGHSLKEAYIEKFSKFLQDPTIHMLTILVDERIAGSVAKFEIQGEAEVTYWIDRSFWGKGLATAALRELLLLESTRPVFGRVAFDNIGSQKVLEKCGFVKISTDKGFANARQTEVEELVYKLS